MFTSHEVRKIMAVIFRFNCCLFFFSVTPITDLHGWKGSIFCRGEAPSIDLKKLIFTTDLAVTFARKTWKGFGEGKIPPLGAKSKLKIYTGWCFQKFFFPCLFFFLDQNRQDMVLMTQGIRLPFATCMIWNTGHYRTYDNRRFDFESSCDYVLSEDVGRSWSVHARNVRCREPDTCTKV